MTAVACWGGVLAVLLLRVSRRTDGGSLLASVVLFCLAILATFAYHFEQWFAFIGEVPAAALLLLGHWLLAGERFTSRAIFLGGLCLGLAVQTKYQAVIATAGALIIFIVQLKRSGAGWRTAAANTRWLVAGCVIPTALFELYKFLHLGSAAYVSNWQEFLVASREMGIQTGTRITLQLLQERAAVLHERFGFHWWGVVAFLAATGALLLRHAATHWRLVFGSVLASVVISGFYWAALSVGRPRYAIICIAMMCFAIVIPILGLPRWWQKLIAAAVICLLLRDGITRAPYVWKTADRGLFRASTERIARSQLLQHVGRVRATEPVQLVSRYWGSFADIEFLLPDSMNFRRMDSVEPSGPKKLILINNRFNDPNDLTIMGARQRATSKVFSGGPYELLEVP
jgi:hypothetical protein